jgi:hypothetical protein
MPTTMSMSATDALNASVLNLSYAVTAAQPPEATRSQINPKRCVPL